MGFVLSVEPSPRLRYSTVLSGPLATASHSHRPPRGTTRPGGRPWGRPGGALATPVVGESLAGARGTLVRAGCPVRNTTRLKAKFSFFGAVRGYKSVVAKDKLYGGPPHRLAWPHGRRLAGVHFISCAAAWLHADDTCGARTNAACGGSGAAVEAASAGCSQ